MCCDTELEADSRRGRPHPALERFLKIVGVFSLFLLGSSRHFSAGRFFKERCPRG
ncbi:hypothetical cytosolic protein [Syntrophus aciditrophicus SB]|uniref:Hypothetical cytosolic protein n=1 Tax=Syntrophus aciditrophicus (strain SB) TaxID=56780 RepID=Q2LYB9_SYNAS|nr:hypothetical cytosolic protein [Syntrophus aciditrophicus SB]